MAMPIMPPDFGPRRRPNLSTRGASGQDGSCPFSPVVATLLRSDFPCTFVKSAYDHGHLQFASIDLSDPHHVRRAYETVSEYLTSVQVAARTARSQAAMKVLLLDVVIVEPTTAESIREAAWALLFRLHEFDRHMGKVWPAQIPQDMDDPRWTYCLNETPIFVNMTSSKLVVRQSRNLGRPLVLVIQPTDGLHLIAPRTPAGDRIRSVIRDRVCAYDGIPCSPFLANSGDAGNADWRQFWLGDSDSESPWRPPSIPSHQTVTLRRSA